jgi:hypothetical protein
MHYCEIYKSNIKAGKFVLRCELGVSDSFLYLDKEDVQFLYEKFKRLKRKGEF